MKKTAPRSAQTILSSEFVFSYNDWAVDSVSGVKETFGSTVGGSVDPTEPGLVAATGVVFDCLPMPAGAVVVGGAVTIETAFAGIGAAATLSLGIAGAPGAYIAGIDLDAAVAGTRVAIPLAASLVSNGGQNVRLTTAGLVATATAGKVRIRIDYTIDGRGTDSTGN